MRMPCSEAMAFPLWRSRKTISSAQLVRITFGQIRTIELAACSKAGPVIVYD
jgi:hypothetical protein